MTDERDPNWPLPSFDAVDWAKSFVARAEQAPDIATDINAMTSWFACALMRGWDEHRWRTEEMREAPRGEA